MSDLSNQDPNHAALAPDSNRLLPEHASESTGEKSGSPLRLIVIIVILLAVAGLIWWRISVNQKATAAEADKAVQAAKRPTPVQVSTVQQKDVPVFLTALGTVTAYNTVTLHSRVDGQLLSVNFTEGQAVRKGALLLQIDPRPYQAAVDQAVGTLAKDQANLKNMQAEAERYTALYQAGVVSKESQQLQISNQGQAVGSIKSDEAAIEAAKVNLGYTRIYSPIDGVVGLRQVDPGNIVHASDTNGLIVITQIHPIAIIFTLPEDQLPQVQKAMKGAKLVVEAYDRTDSHKIAAGTLLTIDNQIDTTTGTAKLKAVFDNPDSALFANQFVNVRLILRERQNATVVPTAAISSGTQGDYVFVVNDGPTPKDKLKNQPGAGISTAGADGKKGSREKTPAADSTSSDRSGANGATGSKGGGKQASCPAQHVDSVPVHVDFALGTSSVLTDGELKPGQKVVIDGQEKLVDGSNVCPITPKPANGAMGASGSSGSSGSGGSTGTKSPYGTQDATGASGATSSTSSTNGGHQ